MFSQKGFTVVEGLLVVLVLSVIGFAGYLVWQKNTDSNQSVQQSETQPTSNIANVEDEPIDECRLPSDYTFETPSGWIEDQDSGLIYSELPVRDDTTTEVPRSKNIYFTAQFYNTSIKTAGSLDVNGQPLEPAPTIFKSVKLKNGCDAYIYKQLSSANEAEASEKYFLADKNINSLSLKNGQYLEVYGVFNTGQADYDTILPLKQNGNFVADSREEVAAFVGLVESIE
jgi:type II secretory pathway pseudopilin PulG